MAEQKVLRKDFKKVDTKEFELPETVFIRDIENRVFQEIVLRCLQTIPGITTAEGNFIENIFGKASGETLKGIYTEQDNRNHSVGIKVEVNIGFGISIPEKAEEIQTQITEEVTKITGLHVSSVHVIFKNLIPLNYTKKGQDSLCTRLEEDNIEEEYTDEF